MGKFFLVIILLAVCLYMWKDNIKEYFALKPAVVKTEQSEDDWCEVKSMDCGDVVRMLNSFSSTRYFEAAGNLLGTSFESLTMRRGDGDVTFLLPRDIQIVHKLSGKGKGTMTVTFDDGYQMKYDKKGNLVSAQQTEVKEVK